MTSGRSVFKSGAVRLNEAERVWKRPQGFVPRRGSDASRAAPEAVALRVNEQREFASAMRGFVPRRGERREPRGA